MKLSTRLGVVVISSLISLLLLGGVGLYSQRSGLMAERHSQIENILNMTLGLLDRYHEAEQSGKMTRADAQAAAINAMLGLRSKNAYLFVRDKDDRMIVHPRADRLGVIDSSNTAEYDKAMAEQGKFGFVMTMTARPGAKAGDKIEKLNAVTRFEPWDWRVGTGFFLDDIDAKFIRHATLLAVLGLVLVAVTMGITIYFARGIYRQLGGEPTYCARMTQQIAEGNLGGQITRAPAGSVLAALAAMQESLRKMIADVQGKADSTRHAAASIQATMGEIAVSSAHSSEATSSTAAAVEQMVVSIGMISDNARETETNSARATELAKNGQVQVKEAAGKIEDIAETINTASTQVSGLAERITKVGGIANVIREIADQTNLLALNAAIEAARAGEQGRGFAVVADEVRKLAERTSLATNDIANTIKAVQEDTSRVVASMQAVGPQVAEGTALAGQAEQSLQGINEGAETTLDKVREIVHATSEQRAASNSIAANVERIASMLEESDKSVQGANASVDDMSGMAADIHAAVSRFRL